MYWRGKQLKVAIVHDWLTNMGGSEKVVLELKKMFPDAPVFTSVYAPERVDKAFKNMNVIPSFIQKLPYSKRCYRTYLPLMPLAFEQFDFTNFDIVISSNHACSKGVILPPQVLHICYCHTPMRYAWSSFSEYAGRLPRFKRIIASILLHYLRLWDWQAARRVDYFIANSYEVAKRIKRYYQRDSTVIHPPVDIKLKEEFTRDEGFYLIVSRLVPYKKIELAINAFNRMNRRLIVVGDGPQRKKLSGIAGSNVQLYGWVSDEKLNELYSTCKSLIFPGEEDFGITPVEAQSYGKPVIAYGRGGILDTVIEGKTGVFFHELTVEALIKSVEHFESCNFDNGLIRKNVEKFSEGEFCRSMTNFINKCLDEKGIDH